MLALVDMPTGTTFFFKKKISRRVVMSAWDIVSASICASALSEGLGAVVDFVIKVIRFEKLQGETTIARLPSGHYIMHLMTFLRTGWNLPSAVSLEMGEDPYVRTALQSDAVKDLDSRVLTSITTT